MDVGGGFRSGNINTGDEHRPSRLTTVWSEQAYWVNKEIHVEEIPYIFVSEICSMLDLARGTVGKILHDDLRL